MFIYGIATGDQNWCSHPYRRSKMMPSYVRIRERKYNFLEQVIQAIQSID
ncbi:hypothetical protein HanXRQr2_Chr13g0569771 [Helianthus annuus]|uniref:Uncharacterized protein n=1 Tax=Helianthus annuus TaxID=4232 RepID=A0A9K3EE78_HELAN|nr:hypothetical protein HanXRQr2_Chr13g0569771 [Helianthus annuus]